MTIVSASKPWTVAGQTSTRSEQAATTANRTEASNNQAEPTNDGTKTSEWNGSERKTTELNSLVESLGLKQSSGKGAACACV